MKRVLAVFGTRPEAIKLCPVVARLRDDPERFHVRVCVTGQHRQMLDQVLTAFAIRPDHDLDIMQPAQTLAESASRILSALAPVIATERPNIVIVQGDTTTTLCGALAAFYARVPVAHVEAGLRTSDLARPFPEEMNRVLTGRLTALHFAATEWAADNLRREGVESRRVFVTGNTVIDALLTVNGRLASGGIRGGELPPLDQRKKWILVTAHRRESFGDGFRRIAAAIAKVAARGDVEIVYPVHPNPNVRGVIDRDLAGIENVHLIPPLDYVPFIDLMRRAHLVLTDSGGVQEEAPSLGKPVLVLRETTERPEAVEAGTARLVGTDVERIVSECSLLLDDPGEYERRAATRNPYGDGQASDRIAGILADWKP
ncbi:MAG TPA: UDP-N-acetylglucosamine 2-epimerase (non-hydrolyzing) [Vicinamibacterales bacterium]|jgi:UDP-N-acetylglucosamine 2-epimerase (non-hydrolysing)|nr:UDP-N-acetylglucosamine 2-epimerase (non-hydrolyzing) [Vicinamibacterales bacterium]